MGKDELLSLFKEYIKENLEVRVETKSRGSECTYNETTTVNLYLDGECISKSEIDGLSKDY